MTLKSKMRENVIFSCVNSPKLKQNCQVLFSLSRKLQNQTKEHHFDQFFSKLRNFVSLFFRKQKITFYPKRQLRNGKVDLILITRKHYNIVYSKMMLEGEMGLQFGFPKYNAPPRKKIPLISITKLLKIQKKF